MMKVTVVLENTVPNNAKRPFRAEHGLSLLLETENQLYLADAGQSDAVLYNLGLLGVCPADLDGIILSHGHYDHAGGLQAVLTHAKKAMPVYAASGVFLRRFFQSGGNRRYIGIPYVRENLESLGAQFHFLDQPFRLEKNLWISGPVPRLTEYETGDAGFVDESGCHDIVPDDMGLYYSGARGMTVITGCAHSGVINMIRYGMTVTGCASLHGMIGGTHLGPVSEDQRQATLAALAELKPNLIAANHCTGFAVMHKLATIFDERFIPAHVGAVIEV